MTSKISANYLIRLSIREERGKLHSKLQEVEEHVGKEGMAEKLSIIIGELANNAVKANLKRLFFHAKGYKFDDAQSYEIGLKAFHDNFAHMNLVHYEKAMQLLDLKVQINIELDENRLLILIENNNSMSAEEELRLRKKMAKVMQRDLEEMLELYVYYGDDMEGLGLGLTMTVDLIRQLGFDPQHFRVYNEGSKTVTRLEFPLKMDYVPIRGS